MFLLEQKESIKGEEVHISSGPHTDDGAIPFFYVNVEIWWYDMVLLDTGILFEQILFVFFL